jgi:long-subunit fatty acid transport protein
VGTLLAILLLSGAATAGPVDIYGYGAQSIGRGQGGIAIADGVTTVFRNPALLHDLKMAEVVIGYGAYRSSFPEVPPLYWDTNQDGLIDENDAPLQVQPDAPSADALTFAIGRNVGKHFGTAFTGFIPTGSLLRFQTIEPAMPNWVMYGNRSQRYEFAIGLGGTVARGLSIGVATEVVARARYRLSAAISAGASAAEEGDSTTEDLLDEVVIDVHDMTLDLVPSFVPIIGAYADIGVWAPALQGLTAGAVYRWSSGVPIDVDIDIQINGSLSDVGDFEPMMLALAIPAQFKIFDHYVPARMSLGAAYQYRELGRAYVDLHHTKWSAMQLNVAKLTAAEVNSELLQIGADGVVDGNAYSVVFEDTVSLNLGAEYFLPTIAVDGHAEQLDIVLRGGFGYVPSPLVSQGQGSVFLDSDRMLFAGGLGFTHLDPFQLVPGPVSWDVFFTMHTLASGKIEPVDAGPHRAGSTIDGQPVPIGGHLWSTGAQWSVEF